MERVGGERVGWCTLLGPEGPGFLLWVVSVMDAHPWWGLGLEGPSLGHMKPEGSFWGSVVPIVC